MNQGVSIKRKRIGSITTKIQRNRIVGTPYMQMKMAKTYIVSYAVSSMQARSEQARPKMETWINRTSESGSSR